MPLPAGAQRVTSQLLGIVGTGSCLNTQVIPGLGFPSGRLARDHLPLAAAPVPGVDGIRAAERDEALDGPRNRPRTASQ